MGALGKSRQGSNGRAPGRDRAPPHTLGALHQGRGGAIFLIGEPGIGKSRLLGKSPPKSLAQLVFRVTEGNPLFIEEVVRTFLASRSDGGTSWSADPKRSLLETRPHC